MRTTRRLLTAVAATALSLTASAALADVVYNDMEDSVDSTIEVMHLQYDEVHHLRGPDGTTRLAIEVDGKYVGSPSPDHNNCNIQGKSQYIELAPVVTGDSATARFPDGLRFDSCSDVLRVVVTPQKLGRTSISFEIKDARTPGDPRTDFNLARAAFDVSVDPADLSSGGGTGTKCDKNPAAPAWAVALLQANGMRPRAQGGPNYVRQVADQMGKRASFPDGAGAMVAKDASKRAYAKAVYTYMTSPSPRGLGLDLTNGLDKVKRPGWTCSSVS